MAEHVETPKATEVAQAMPTLDMRADFIKNMRSLTNWIEKKWSADAKVTTFKQQMDMTLENEKLTKSYICTWKLGLDHEAVAERKYEPMVESLAQMVHFKQIGLREKFLHRQLSQAARESIMNLVEKLNAAALSMVTESDADYADTCALLEMSSRFSMQFGEVELRRENIGAIIKAVPNILADPAFLEPMIRVAASDVQFAAFIEYVEASSGKAISANNKEMIRHAIGFYGRLMHGNEKAMKYFAKALPMATKLVETLGSTGLMSIGGMLGGGGGGEGEGEGEGEGPLGEGGMAMIQSMVKSLPLSEGFMDFM